MQLLNGKASEINVNLEIFGTTINSKLVGNPKQPTIPHLKQEKIKKKFLGGKVLRASHDHSCDKPILIAEKEHYFFLEAYNLCSEPYHSHANL